MYIDITPFIVYYITILKKARFCNMKYRHYKKAIEKLNNEKELRRLLYILENSDDVLSSSGYYNLRYLIIKKIYK
nr:MAG TPA_asm: hypothetical protein [Caudoviricetes sp.]